MIATKKDNCEEIFPIVDADGVVLRSATRGECHSGSMLLHPVVHLQVFNSRGEVFLQQRPAWKDIQPNMWDTAVGGHIDYGERVEEALRREAYEELGIEGFEAHFVDRYIFESSVEREMIYTYYAIYDGVLTPSAETDGGRFWSRDEVLLAIERGGVVTPNFSGEYLKHYASITPEATSSSSK